MNTEKTPTIYGGVTFEQFEAAAQTIVQYLNGLTGTYAIRDLIKDEHKTSLKRDATLAAIVDIQLADSRMRFVNMIKEMTKTLRAANEAEKAETTTEPEQTEQTEQTENL